MSVDQRPAPGVSPEPEFNVDDPRLTRFDLVREGARRDGVEIVHYEPRFQPGRRKSKAEKRIERAIALLLVLSGLFALGSVVSYIVWPFRYQSGPVASKLFTPLLGLGIGGSLALLGAALVVYAKKLLPEEVSVQERHIGGSPDDEQRLTGASLLNMADETGIRRRPLLKAALLLPAGGLAVATAAPLVGSLLVNPNQDQIFLHTGWDPKNNGGKPIRLVRDDGTPIRPEEVSVRGQVTAFPGIPEGTTNKYADSPVLLINLSEDDAARLRESIAAAKQSNSNPPVVEGLWQNFVAYSKICTHAGCPASLFEQQTNRLLCPCHQSQFSIVDQAVPIFGPATRKLPMLPLDLQDGFLVARSDFLEPVGPGYWERPSTVNQT